MHNFFIKSIYINRFNKEIVHQVGKQDYIITVKLVSINTLHALIKKSLHQWGTSNTDANTSST